MRQCGNSILQVWNKHQVRVAQTISSGEEILPPLLLGFELATFQSPDWCSTNWTIPTPTGNKHSTYSLQPSTHWFINLLWKPHSILCDYKKMLTWKRWHNFLRILNNRTGSGLASALAIFQQMCTAWIIHKNMVPWCWSLKQFFYLVLFLTISYLINVVVLQVKSFWQARAVPYVRWSFWGKNSMHFP